MKITLLLTMILLVSCNTEEAGEFLSQATEAKQTTGEESTSTDSELVEDEVTLECSLNAAVKAKCFLPQIAGEKAFRITSIEVMQNNGPSDCELHKNLRVLGSLKGILIRKGCEGTFAVKTTQSIKRIKYGTTTDWSEIEIKALDFGEAQVEDGKLLSDHDSGALKTDTNGLGVAGGRHAGNQINYDVNLGTSQGLLFELPDHTLGFNIVLSNLYQSESTGERAHIIVLDESGEVIVEKKRSKLGRYKDQDRNHVGQVRFRGLEGAKYVLVKALHYRNVEEVEGSDSSDFYVRYLNVITSK